MRKESQKQGAVCFLYLIRSRTPLVELRKAHANTHRVLQVLLSATFYTTLFLLVQGFPSETLHAVTEASLYQGIIHLQAVMQAKPTWSTCVKRDSFLTQIAFYH